MSARFTLSVARRPGASPRVSPPALPLQFIVSSPLLTPLSSPSVPAPPSAPSPLASPALLSMMANPEVMRSLVASNPALVERFLKAFFASIDFMKANKEKTTEVAARVTHQTVSAMNKTYDYEISMLETDGHFDPEAVEVIKDSFVGMGILTEKPANDLLFTTRFLPVKP